MRAHLFGIGGLSLAALFLAMPSLGQAQSGRPWIDPPAEAGPAAPSSSPSSTAQETKPAAASPTPSPAPSPAASAPAAHATASTQGVMKDTPRQEKLETSPSKPSKSASRSVSKKVTSEERTRPQSRGLVARSDRSRQGIQRRDVAEQDPRGGRAERIREGVNSGLEVMTLRTIEFPDGRRMQILTRPRPGEISELMNAQE